MLDTLNDQLSSHVLERFITTFLGYGNVRAPLWFIGKEEGGDCSPDSLRERFAWWQARGCLAVDDLEEYHAQTRLARFVHREAQATWIQLSRVALAAQFLPSDRAASLAYQIRRLGRRASDTALFEFLPLPAEGTSHWPYGMLSDLPVLRTRAVYEREVAPIRVRLIQQMIDEHRPAVVVMYGNNATYRPRWAAIAGQLLSETALEHVDSKFNRVWHCERGESKLVIMEHPTHFGPTNAYFEAVGKFIAGFLRRPKPKFEGEE